MAASHNRRHFITTLGTGIVASQVIPFQAKALPDKSDSKNDPLPEDFVLPHTEKFFPIDIREIKLSGEIGRRIEATVFNNLLKVDIDGEFLSSFIGKGNPKAGFVGAGMMLDAVVKFAAHTGDRQVIALKNHMVDVLLKNQEPDGYIGNMKADGRMIKLWDIHEVGYIIYGLVSDYRLFTEDRSLEAAKKAAGYLLDNWHRIGAGWERETHVATHVAITGIHRTMLALHRITGEKKYLDFCLDKHDLRKWEPGIVIGRKDLIEGHIYGYMAASLAQLELYPLIKEKALTGPAIAAVNFLTASDGMAVTGGAGQVEIWADDQDGRGDLGESCATAYQLRVYDQLLRLTGDSRFGDIMERTIHNALFGAQSPDGRKIRYFTPTEGPRVYHHNDSYCCPNNFRRIVADLPQMVIYSAPDTVVVNLYAESEATVSTGKIRVKIRQETGYPSSGNVAIVVEPEVAGPFDLRLRIPLWCTSAQVRVNGLPVNEKIAAGSFFSIERTWNVGDRINLELPMAWRLVKGRKRQSGRVVVIRGPQLYCLNPMQDGRLKSMDGVDLGKMVIDLAAIAPEPVTDHSVRSGGTACSVKAGKSQWGMGNTRDLSLILTEFADPEGECTYFRTPDMNEAVEDELVVKLFP